MSQPDDEYREIIAPGAIKLPDGEVPVTLNWGPRIGSARLKVDGRNVVADMTLDGDLGAAAAAAAGQHLIGELSFSVAQAIPAGCDLTRCRWPFGSHASTCAS